MVSHYLRDKYRLLTMADQVLQDLAPASLWNSTTVPQHLCAANAGPSFCPRNTPRSLLPQGLRTCCSLYLTLSPSPLTHTPQYIHTRLAASEQIAPPWKSSLTNHQVYIKKEGGRKYGVK